ncbi:MAG: hypothetical protein AAB660_03000 [Patescibacteria group bacterium]
MARKSDVALMVQGLGLAMEFLRRLIIRVVERGGYEEMIHFLTTERGDETIKQIADLIIRSPWRVPASLIQRLAAEQSRKEGGDEKYVERDRRFLWVNVLQKLGVPILSFGYGQDKPITDEIRSQLVNKILVYPMIVQYEESSMVMCDIAGDTDEGKLIPEEVFSRDLALSLAPTEWIDFSR